ncbi:hypothetical protein [Micromonospora echinospora]|uniref:hypothetical protein n=1 Tax=Micromonospora echinospora TaxID=1877 RepID=UPI003A84A67C
MQPPAGSQVSRVPAQRTPQEDLAPPPAQPVPVPPRRRLRTVLTVAGVVLTVLCLSGAVTVYILYSRASAPDRTSPEVAVVNYLQAFLVDRNDARAEAYTCQDSTGLGPIERFRDEIVTRERELEVTFSINIEKVTVSKAGSSDAVVAAVVRRSASVDGLQQSLTDGWRFELRDLDGWRVCRAELA